MIAWWESISLLEQIFCVVALPATIILVLQTIMLLFGGHGAPDSGLDSDVSGLDGHDGGFDMSHDGDFAAHDGGDAPQHGDDAAGLRILSVRGVLAFLTVSGWSGVLFLESGLHEALAIVLAALLGFLALYGMAKLAQLMLRLQESGNPDYRRALGQTARVYLTIPASRAGMGKINLTLGEAYGEFWAVTEGKEPIKTGEQVRVVDLMGDTFVVERE